MANFIYLTLDTTPPANPSLSILGGATYATNQLIDVSIGTTDEVLTGYQMKIWGDVDTAYDSNIQPTEETSTWITHNNSRQLKLSGVDGNKTLNVKIRDKVFNESSVASDSVTLNTSIPTVSMTNFDVDTISKNAGKDSASFTFTSDKIFVEYKVKVVSSTGAAESTGSVIGTAGGSLNTIGTGSFANGTPITVTIKGADYELASSGDGQKIVRVFVKDEAGLWSA